MWLDHFPNAFGLSGLPQFGLSGLSQFGLSITCRFLH